MIFHRKPPRHQINERLSNAITDLADAGKLLSDLNDPLATEVEQLARAVLRALQVNMNAIYGPDDPTKPERRG